MAARPRNDSPTRWVTRIGDSWTGFWEVYAYDASGEPIMVSKGAKAGQQKKLQYRRKIGAARGPKRMTEHDAYMALCQHLEVAADDSRPSLQATLGELWDRYKIKYHRTSPGQRSTMTGIWANHIGPQFGAMKPKDVQPRDIEIFMDGLAVNYRSSFLDKVRTLLSAMFDYAVQERLARVSPMKRIQVRIKTGPAQAALTAAEVRAIRGELTGEDLLKFDICWQTGISRSELRALRRDDITPEGLRIDEGYDEGRLTDLKTERREGVIPLTADLAARLEPFADGSARWLWSADKGAGPWNAEFWMERVLRPAAKAAGVKKHVTFQMLRRTTGTLFRQTGASTVAVAGVLRNSPAITERHYSDTRQVEAQRLAMETMTAGVLEIEKGRVM